MPVVPENSNSGRASETARARAAIYGVLSRVFAGKPTSELLRALKKREMLDALSAFEVVMSPDFIAGDDTEQAHELAVEFTRLFIGPGPHIAPYESVFVLGDGEDLPRLWGKATLEVADFYAEAGLSPAEQEVPDHLSLELEAVAALAREEAEQWESGDTEEATRLRDLQKSFCSEHLERWVPEFCRAVSERSASGFYRNMALLAKNTVRMHCGGEA